MLYCDETLSFESSQPRFLPFPVPDFESPYGSFQQIQFFTEAEISFVDSLLNFEAISQLDGFEYAEYLDSDDEDEGDDEPLVSSKKRKPEEEEDSSRTKKR